MQSLPLRMALYSIHWLYIISLWRIQLCSRACRVTRVVRFSSSHLLLLGRGNWTYNQGAEYTQSKLFCVPQDRRDRMPPPFLREVGGIRRGFLKDVRPKMALKRERFQHIEVDGCRGGSPPAGNVSLGIVPGCQRPFESLNKVDRLVPFLPRGIFTLWEFCRWMMQKQTKTPKYHT